MTNSDELITTVTDWFDTSTELHLVDSLDKVYEVFCKVEEFVESIGLTPEHELTIDEFEDVPVTDLANENQLNEVHFVLPLMKDNEPHELSLEFTYQKVAESEYAIWVDVDFYIEDDSDD